MAEIAQLQQITNSMASSYGGVTGRGSMKNITPGANVMSASEVAIDEQTSVLEDVRELQQQQLQQAFLTNSFLAKSFQLEMDKVRRAREQGTEMKKELSKMTGAGAVAGSLGMAGSVTGDETGGGGGSGLIDLATTGVAVGGGVAATKAVAGAVTGSKSKVNDTDAKKLDKEVKEVKDAKKSGNRKSFFSKVKKLAGNKYIKGTGVAGALLSIISIGSEITDVSAARATGDEELIREEERDVAEAVGGAAGAAGGAVAGAAIGSVIPVVGTFVGGLVGGAVGYFGGDLIGGGLFDVFKDGSDKKKQREEEFQAAAAKRIPIKKSALAGRGFNHKKVETYWFGKAPNGNWLVYKDQYARSPMGYVEDPELIDFLEGRISELPNLAEQIKADKEVMESNSVVPADPLEGSTQTTDLTKTQTPKVKTGKIGDDELTSFDDSNLVETMKIMKIGGGGDEPIDKYSVMNPPKELVDRVTAQLGSNHYKLEDKIRALNAKRLTMILPDLINNTPPFEIEARGKLQNSLKEAHDWLNNPETMEALTEGETFKDKLLGFLKPTSKIEGGRAKEISSQQELSTTSQSFEDGSYVSKDQFASSVGSKTSGFLENFLADKGEVLERFMTDFTETINKNGKETHRRTDMYIERMKGGLFSGDIYKIRQLGITEDGENVALQRDITIDKDTFNKIKEASSSDDKVDQLASVSKQISLGMIGERGSDFENYLANDVKPVTVANNTNNLAPIDTGGGGSVNVVNNQPMVNNTSQNQVTNNTASLDTTQDPYKDKQQHTF